MNIMRPEGSFYFRWKEFDQVKDERNLSKWKSHRSCAAGTGTYRICNRGNDLYRFLGGATDIVTAFSGCDAETSLIFATMITVFLC